MTPRITRRTFVSATAGLAARAAPARAGEAVLRVVAPWEFDSPDPLQTGYVLRRIGVGETLVGVRPDGTLVGLLAESWAVDPDRLTWRFVLRDARFHDGTHVDAAHVAATLERVRAKAESLSGVPVAEVRADGERALVIRTARPFAPLPAFLTDYAGTILAPSAYGPGGVAAGAPERPIGTGPYRVTAQDGARTIDAEAFPAYWGSQPAIGRIRYSAVVLGETRANLAAAGQADLAFSLLPQAAATLAAGTAARIVAATIPRVRMLTMNLRLPQFADIRVRRALSLAIDRAGIAAAILRHPASAATQLLPPVLTGWFDPALPSLHQDLPEARRLLAEAGWAPGADGVLAKDGRSMRAGLAVVSNRPELPLMAQALQAQLRAVGVALDIKPVPPGALAGMVRDRSLQTGLLARTYVNVPDPIGTILPDFAGDHPVWTSPGFDDPALRDAVERYLSTFDDAGKPALRRDIVTALQDRLPVIPVSWFEHNVAVSPRLAVGSVALDPFEQSYLLGEMRWA